MLVFFLPDAIEVYDYWVVCLTRLDKLQGRLAKQILIFFRLTGRIVVHAWWAVSMVLVSKALSSWETYKYYYVDLLQKSFFAENIVRQIEPDNNS